MTQGVSPPGGVATLGAPLILAVSYVAMGSYDLTLYITAGIMLVATVLPLIVRPLKSPQEEAEPG